MALKWVREPLERSMYYYRAVVGKTVYSVDHDHRNGRWYAWRRDPGVASSMGADGQIKGSAALGWATTPAKAKKFAEADAAARSPTPQKRANPRRALLHRKQRVTADDIYAGAGAGKDESRWIIYVVDWTTGAIARYDTSYGKKSAAAVMRKAKENGFEVVWKVPAQWSAQAEGYEPIEPVHAPVARKHVNPDSPAVSRYLRAVRAQQRKGTKNVQLTWTTETIGDTPVHSAQLDGVRIRVYAPSRTMGDLYQVYAGHQHYSNAHSLREAKVAGREAAAYYSGRGPNSMGRMASEHERAQGARTNPARRDKWMIAAMAEPKPKRVKLTKDQKKALDAYNFALSQEDRYLGSVFVTPAGQRRVEATTAEAYARCVALGMTHEHGL